MSSPRQPGKVEMPTQQPISEQEDIARQPGRIQEAVAELADEQLPIKPQLTAHTEQPSLWGKTLGFFLLSGFVWLLASILLSLLQLWDEQRWLAILLAAVSSLALLYFFRLLLSEWRASKRLDEVAQRQLLFASAKQGDDIELFNRQFAAVRQQLNKQYPQQLADYQQDMQQRDSVAAKMQLAENTWLAELDKQAQALIRQEAMTVGGAVALVPHPVLDAVVVLWRSQRMIRKLGQLYGLQPTGLSSWKLFKAAMLNTLLVGALDTASELLAEQTGYGVVETAVGKGAVQGVVMGQRMRRLGRQAQQLCRPWVS